MDDLPSLTLVKSEVGSSWENRTNTANIQSRSLNLPQESWRKIPEDCLQKLQDSWPKRVEVMLKKKVGKLTFSNDVIYYKLYFHISFNSSLPLPSNLKKGEQYWQYVIRNSSSARFFIILFSFSVVHFFWKIIPKNNINFKSAWCFTNETIYLVVQSRFQKLRNKK